MDFAIFLLIVAVLLLTNINRLELISSQYELIKKTTSVNYSHAHNLVIDLGDTLINTEGLQQYKELKPRLEQAKRYYLNNENKRYLAKADLESRKPVKLKIVS